jgi:hypothetical protein
VTTFIGVPFFFSAATLFRLAKQPASFIIFVSVSKKTSNFNLQGKDLLSKNERVG